MIIYILKTGLCMGILLLFYHLVLEKESTYRFNRFFLLSAMLFSLTIPFLESPIQWPIIEKPKEVFNPEIENAGKELDLPHESAYQFESNLPILVQAESWYLKNWICILYSIVTSILVVRLILQLKNFHKLIKNHPILIQSNCLIVLLNKNTSPFTFFNYLFVSADSYYADGIEPEIWEHELAHIREGHSYDILLMEVMKVIFWFNPIVYFYKKAIQLNHEFLADRSVTTSFINIPKYQKLLIDKISVNEGVFSLSSPINYTITKKRLKMMYKQTSLGKSTLVQVSLLPIVFLMTGLLGTAADQTSAPSSTPSLSENGSLKAQYEYYINEAINVQKPDVMLLQKLNIDGLTKVYQQMSAEEREAVSSFPFIEDEETIDRLRILQGLKNPYEVEFIFSSPPVKKSISSEVWSAWMEAPFLLIEIDGNTFPRQILTEFSPTDFSLYTAVEEIDPMNGAVVKVSLTTNEHYYQNYVKAIKKVIGVKADYNRNLQLEIPYGYITLIQREGIIKTSTPENLPLAILDMLINPVKERKNFINMNKDEGFPITVIEGNSKKSQYVITK